MASSGSTQPSPTLYVTNLETKIKKDDLRRSLYGLFSQHGKVIDVVALKGKMRGQAFVVFHDLQSATNARRREDGNIIFGKPLKIAYAKSKSHATVLQESGPEALYAIKLGLVDENTEKVTLSRAEKDNREAHRIKTMTEKRERENEEEEEDDDDEHDQDKRAEKMRKPNEDGDEEMEIEEDSDDEGPQPASKVNGEPATNILLVGNLPVETESQMLTVLFTQFSGFVSVKMNPISQETKTRSAQIKYESANDARVAKESLDGFQIDKGVHITLTYSK